MTIYASSMLAWNHIVTVKVIFSLLVVFFRGTSSCSKLRCSWKSGRNKIFAIKWPLTSNITLKLSFQEFFTLEPVKLELLLIMRHPSDTLNHGRAAGLKVPKKPDPFEILWPNPNPKKPVKNGFLKRVFWFMLCAKNRENNSKRV